MQIILNGDLPLKEGIIFSDRVLLYVTQYNLHYSVFTDIN